MRQNGDSYGGMVIDAEHLDALQAYSSRMSTFTCPTALAWGGSHKNGYSKMYVEIQRRVSTEGATYVYTPGGKPSSCSGATLLGCLSCGAALNIEHGYFGKGGSFDPREVERIDALTREFWFNKQQQRKLGILGGTPDAAHMCTAETLHPGSRMYM